jgi:MFS family permease
MKPPIAIAWSGLAALAVAMGIGRFAFTPLLPMMQADAGLSLAQGGWLASANYVGYFAGALWAAAQPVRAAAAIRAGLLAISVTTAAMGAVDGFTPWLVLRAAAGVASAWVLVHVSAWVLGELTPLRRPILGGVVYAGVGTGIAVAGVLCVAVMAMHASSAQAWIALGAISLLVTAAIWPALASGVQPSGAKGEKTPLTRAWLKLVLCYGAFGFGYIIPATYLPVMARESVADPALFGWAWPLLGAAAAISTLAAAPLLGKMDHRQVWAASHLVMALGVVAPLALPGLAGILIAAAGVGGTFMVATMVGLQEGRRVAGARAARLMGAMTAAFAAGQIVGPALVTLWISRGGTLSAGLAFAGVVLAVSALALLRNRIAPSA